MGAGFQVRGDHGVFQIDQEFRNLAKVANGEVTGIVALNNGVNPVLACRTLDTGGVMPGGVNISGSTFSWGWRQTPVGASYWIYDSTPALTGSGYGLQVRHMVTKEIIFDARYDYMDVVGQFTLNAPSTPYGGYTQPSGTTHAWIQIDTGLWEKDNSNGVTDQGGFQVYMNGSGQLVTTRSLTMGGRSGPAINGPYVDVRLPQVIVVDVTGL